MIYLCILLHHVINKFTMNRTITQWFQIHLPSHFPWTTHSIVHSFFFYSKKSVDEHVSNWYLLKCVSLGFYGVSSLCKLSKPETQTVNSAPTPFTKKLSLTSMSPCRAHHLTWVQCWNVNTRVISSAFTDAVSEADTLFLKHLKHFETTKFFFLSLSLSWSSILFIWLSPIFWL